MGFSYTEEILLDPFHGGRILSSSDCEALVEQATGEAFSASALALEPVPIGLIVQRMLNNLKAIYLKQNDWARAIRTMERLRLLSPEDVVLRRDLGVSLLRHGQPGKAIDHLRRYLETAHEAQDLDNVRQVLNIAMNTIAQWN